MTTAEHLDRIKARCRAIEAGDWRPDTSLPGGGASVVKAMARSTVAAIDGLSKYPKWLNNSKTVSAILAAWPEELL